MNHAVHHRLRVTAIAAVALLGLAVTLHAQAPAAWKTYPYASDGFSASYPSSPEVTKRSISTDAGPFELRSYIATDGNVALFVGVCDYGAATAGKDPATLLQGAKNGALQNSGSQLTREKTIKLGIYPGIEFESETADTHFIARVYFVGSTLYQVLVVAPIATPYPQQTQFLDSFQLIPRPQ